MRPVPLTDEIKMHLLLWGAEDDWKKLSSGLKVALTTALNEIKIKEALKENGLSDEREDASQASSMKQFIAIYKKRYHEYTSFENMETFDAGSRFIIQNLCNNLKSEGAEPIDYISWFFDEFLKVEFNKKAYGSPPSIRKVVSNDIYSKFLFEKKSTLKARKEDMASLTVRNAILEMATKYLETSKNIDFGKNIQDYLRGKISLKKFGMLFHNLLIENKEEDLAEKLDSIIGNN